MQLYGVGNSQDRAGHPLSNEQRRCDITSTTGYVGSVWYDGPRYHRPVTGQNIPGQNIPWQNIPGENIREQNIPDKIYPDNRLHTGQNMPDKKYPDKIYWTICTRQKLPDKIYWTKYTGQNIPNKIYRTKYTLSFADQLDVSVKARVMVMIMDIDQRSVNHVQSVVCKHVQSAVSQPRPVSG